jgi:HK97 family phage portal protein
MNLSNTIKERAYVIARNAAPEMLHNDILAALVKGYDEIGSTEIAGDGYWVDNESNIAAGQLIGLYETHLFVNICVHYVASRAAKPRIKFYRVDGVNSSGEEDRELVVDDPIVRMFNWWNPEQSPYECWEWIYSYLQLGGLAYVAKLAPDTETPWRPEGIKHELWPLFPEKVKVIRGVNRAVIGYEYQVAGSPTLFAPEEVMVFRTFSTDMRGTGMGRLYAGRKQITTDLRARAWNDALLKKGVHVSGTLETEENIDQKKAQLLEEKFNKKYAGQSNAGRVITLFGGLKFKPSTLAHKDIHWIEQLNMNKEDIAEAHGLSMELLGAKSPNRAALEEKRKIFWEDTIRGVWHERVISILNGTILPALDPSLRAEYDYSKVEALQPDRNETIRAGGEAVKQTLMTPNEVRTKWLDLAEIEGGDELLIGRGMTTVSVMLEESIRNAVESATGGTSSDADKEKSISKMPPSLRAIALSAIPGVARKQEEWRLIFDKWFDAAETEYQNIIREYLRSMEKASIGLLSSGKTEAEVMAALQETVGIQGSRAFVARSKETLRRLIENTGNAMLTRLGIEAALDLENSASIARLATQGRRIKDISDRRWLQLRSKLQTGLAEGRSEAGLRDIVSEFFRNERSNALTIARTETVPAINGAATDAYIQANKLHGIVVYSQWLTSGDDKVRDLHAPANGQTIDPTIESFNVGGEALRFPGDFESSRDAGNVINCRCAVRPVFEKG